MRQNINEPEEIEDINSDGEEVRRINPLLLLIFVVAVIVVIGIVMNRLKTC